MSDHSADSNLGLAHVALRAGFCCAFTAVVAAAVLSMMRFVAG